MAGKSHEFRGEYTAENGKLQQVVNKYIFIIIILIIINAEITLLAVL